MKSLRLLIIGSLFISSAAFAQTESVFSQKEFTDVPVGSTYYEGIEYLRTQNVLKGYLDGQFKPGNRINRAEFLMFIVNPLILDTNNLSNCLPENASATEKNIFFSDIPNDAWYGAEACFSKTKGLVNGYPDGTFGPAKYINFVEAAKIISNVFALDVKVEAEGEFWYRPYVQRLSDLHAIPASITRFDQTMTRGEVAEIVFRLKADRADKASASFSSIR